MIKGIGFDLQFTLVYLENFSLKRWFELFDAGFERVINYLSELGLQYDEKKLKRTLSRMRNRYFAKTITEDQQYFTEETLNETFSKCKIALLPEDFTKCVHLYHSAEILAWKSYPKVQDTLKQLSKTYKLAIITNASEYVTNEILKLQKLKRYFGFVFTRARKPRFPSFKEFREAMHANFDELVIIGDDIYADIKPAIQLGMKTIHAYRGYEYLKHHARSKIMPHKKIHKFDEVIKAIEELDIDRKGNGPK